MNTYSYIVPMKSSPLKESVEAFKILSSTTRFAILKTLIDVTCDICVNEIADKVSMSQSATSHQLSTLEGKGIISATRNGQIVCYHLTDTPLAQKIKRLMKESV